MSISDQLQKKIDFYESLPVLSFLDIHPEANFDYIRNSYFNFGCYSLFDSFLFHGVRLDKNLEKFESILKHGKILAGNQVSTYHPYYENCNEGKYVSLLELNNESLIEVDAFLEYNITFVVKPTSRAIKTLFVNDFEWDEIKENQGSFDKFHQRYSSIDGEYQIKDSISLDEDILGIYIPVNSEFRNNEGLSVYDLLKKYNYGYLPIFKTSLVQIASTINKKKTQLDYENWIKNSDFSNNNIQSIGPTTSDESTKLFNILVSEHKTKKKQHVHGSRFDSGFKLMRKHDYRQKISYKSYKKPYVKNIRKQ